MKSKLLPIIVALLLTSSVAQAHEGNFNETKKLVDSGISCNELGEHKLEEIGEYYMEQMHPGEAHEMMDKMMGGEGSDSLNQMHIRMAKRLYCNEDVGGMMGNNMMGSDGMTDNSMMNNYPPTGNLVSSAPFNLLIIALIILVVLFIAKLSKDISKRR